MSAILNGDSPIPTRIVEGVVQPVASTTAEQKLARKNELKARGALLMALPNKHQLNLNPIKMLRHSWRLLKSDLRNKADLKDKGLDDLFNSLKINETKVKHSSSTSTKSHNLAFVSSSQPDSTTDSVSAAVNVSAVGSKLHASPLPNIDVDDLKEIDLRWQMAMLTMRARRAILLGSVGLQRIQEGLVQLSPREGLSQLRPQPKMPWSLNVMVHVAMIGTIKQRRSLQTLLLWLFPQAYLLIIRFIPSGGYHTVPPPYTGTFMPPKPDLVFYTALSAKTEHLAFNVQTQDLKVVPSFAQSSEHVKSPRPPGQPLSATIPAFTPVPYASLNHYKSHTHMVPTALLPQSKSVLNTAARPVSAVLPNLPVTQPNHAYRVVTKSNSLIKRHFPRSPSSKTSNSTPRVTAAKAPVVSAAQELNGGYVAFGGNPKGGKITGK
nr:hypothetical protein [Tanacetum cinerariifolium]